MATDPRRALADGSPGLTMLIVGLGGAVLSRALVGRTVLARAVRRDAAGADGS